MVDRDVTDKLMGRPWSEASVARWHHASHFLLLTLGSQHCCRDVVIPFFSVGTQSPKYGRLLIDLQCADSGSHISQRSLEILSQSAGELLGEFVNYHATCRAGRLACVTWAGGSVTSALALSPFPCSKHYRLQHSIFSSCSCPLSQLLVPLPCLVSRHLHKVGVIVFGLPGRLFHRIAQSATLGA